VSTARTHFLNFLPTEPRYTRCSMPQQVDLHYRCSEHKKTSFLCSERINPSNPTTRAARIILFFMKWPGMYPMSARAVCAKRPSSARTTARQGCAALACSPIFGMGRASCTPPPDLLAARDGSSGTQTFNRWPVTTAQGIRASVRREVFRDVRAPARVRTSVPPHRACRAATGSAGRRGRY